MHIINQTQSTTAYNLKFALNPEEERLTIAILVVVIDLS